MKRHDQDSLRRSLWLPFASLMLVAGGAALESEARRILDKLGHGPYIFNLGHGVVPQTPPEHVAHLVEIVRTWKPGGA